MRWPSALLSAAVTYAIGRRLGQGLLRKFAGRRLNRLSQRLGRRGLLAMVIVRLLPIAPYSIVNVVAGASQIGWRDFMLGTAIGLTPGIFGISLFVDRALTAIRHPGPLTFSVLAVIVALLVAGGWMIRRQLGEPRNDDDGRSNHRRRADDGTRIADATRNADATRSDDATRNAGATRSDDSARAAAHAD